MINKVVLVRYTSIIYVQRRSAILDRIGAVTRNDIK